MTREDGAILKIRPANVQDAPTIARLVMDLTGLFVPHPDAPETATFMASLSVEATAERIASEAFECFVAELSGELLGVIVVRDKTHVYHLFVRSTSHRTGVARALWDHVRGRYNRTNFTVNASPYALPAYQRLGFEPTDEPKAKDGLVFIPMVYRDER